MTHLKRREFLRTASAATVVAATRNRRGFAASSGRLRVFIASHTPNGILKYDWDLATGTLAPAGVAAQFPTVAWLEYSRERGLRILCLGAGHVRGQADRRSGQLSRRGRNFQPLSARNSAGTGTCHVGVDHTGRMLLSADYTGGSVASFRIEDGKLSEAVWTEHYIEHGPDAARQEAAHAHFASFSPDNRFAYINDLGGDSIHIYKPDPATAEMTPAGTYHGAPDRGRARYISIPMATPRIA